MKKIFIFIFILLSTAVFSWTNKFDRIDFYYIQNTETQARVTRNDNEDGKYIFVSDDRIKSREKDYGFKIEVYQPLLKVANHKIKIGYGLKIQEPIRFDSDYSNLSYIIPVYVSTLYEYNADGYDIYGKFNIGAAPAVDNKNEVRVFDGNSDARIQGGLHFSLETGVVYKNIIFGLSYDQTSTKLFIPHSETQNKGTVDIDFSIISLNLGYKFSRIKPKN